MISLIAAVAENYTIGRDGDLPWRLPADLKWFRANTIGKACVMGRKTFETLGRPLPNRRNLVVTGRTGFVSRGVEAFHSIDAALAAAGSGEIMILGGSSIYRAVLERAERLYLTIVHADVAGDTSFPRVSESDWAVRSAARHRADEHHEHSHTFLVLERTGRNGALSERLPEIWTSV